jgi:hypothetical protein
VATTTSTRKRKKRMTQDNLPAEGMEEPTKTHLGFGGKTINRILEIEGDNELFLLLRCEIVSDSRKETNGKMRHGAGARTTILAELTHSEAAAVADRATLDLPIEDDEDEDE